VDEKRTDFLIQVAVIDKFIDINPIDDPIATDVIICRLKESKDLLNYFFSKRPSCEWAESLFSYGIFDDPVNVIVVENGYKTPFWPQSRYLKEIASLKPELVLRVIQGISTNNPTIQRDLLDSLIDIPMHSPSELFPIIHRWLNNEFNPAWNLMSESAINLILQYFQREEVDYGIKILKILLNPKPKYLQSQDKSYREVESQFNLSYLRIDFWKDALINFEKYYPEEVFMCLIENLLLSLEMEGYIEKKNNEFIPKRSSLWRNSIGDSTQDKYGGYKGELLVAARDSLLRIIKNNFELGASLIDYLFNQHIIILNRIALFEIATNPNLFIDLISKCLVNKEYVYNIEFHNDYFELLEHGYPVLKEGIQNKVISLILRGPSEEKINEISVIFNESFTKNDFINNWVRDRLWVIKKHLNKEILGKLVKLEEKYGEPTYPQYTSYISDVFWIHDESPLSIQEILSRTSEQLSEYLKSFTPNEFGSITRDEISHKGFAKNIAEAFYLKPKLFTGILSEFTSLPHPYISEILTFGREKIKDNKDIPWNEILIILRVVEKLSQKIETKEESEKYFEQRLQAMWFVNSVLQQELVLPYDVFNEIFDIIIEFLNDFDPDQERDNPPEGYFGHNDPITLSINSIRPIALNSLFRMISIEQKDGSKSGRLKIFYKVIEDKLDRNKETSWAVHSVFGEWSNLLFELDPNWFSDHLEEIFPERSGNEKYFLSAWCSYLVHNFPTIEALNTIRTKFHYAIKLFSEGKKIESNLSCETRFIYFMLMDYFWNNYKITESSDKNLINFFIRTCDFEGKGKVILVLSNLIESMKEYERKEHWSKIYDIWKWRITEFILSGYSNEFLHEIKWFSYMLLKLGNLASVDRYYQLIEPMTYMIENEQVWRNLEDYLSTQVEKYPHQSIKLYRVMHDKRKEDIDNRTIFYDKESRKILELGMKDKRSKIDTLKLINKISRYDLQFRDLYDEYTK
jgi:hypothetical protein